MAVSLLLSVWLAAPPEAVDARFERLAPAPAVTIDAEAMPRRGANRAVVLLHGLRLQPISEEAAKRAEPSYWEKPQAPIVQALSRESDVFAFHYAQTAPVDDIARLPELSRAIRWLRHAGYAEVVLVGYSAGGIIARQFVEDQPGAGVTKVIQVCAPNGGSDWTVLSRGVRTAQIPFVRSLAKEARAAVARERADRRLPDQVEFACVVGACNVIGDGMVRRDCQWTSDLQDQGIPAEIMFIQHFGAMYSPRIAHKVADLIRTPQPRWTSDQVVVARPKVLGWLAPASQPTSFLRTVAGP